MTEHQTTDLEALRSMLTRAGIENAGDGRSIEVTDKFLRSVWFEFDDTGCLKEIMSSGC